MAQCKCGFNIGDHVITVGWDGSLQRVVGLTECAITSEKTATLPLLTTIITIVYALLN